MPAARLPPSEGTRGRRVVVVMTRLRIAKCLDRHLISDAHEWINEIPTVPIYINELQT